MRPLKCKRFLAILVAAFLAFGMINISAFAATGEGENPNIQGEIQIENGHKVPSKGTPIYNYDGSVTYIEDSTNNAITKSYVIESGSELDAQTYVPSTKTFSSTPIRPRGCDQT